MKNRKAIKRPEALKTSVLVKFQKQKSKWNGRADETKSINQEKGVTTMVSTNFYPEYQLNGTWTRFTRRGLDVVFSTEAEAQEYAASVRTAETRVVSAPVERRHLAPINNRNEGFSLMR